MTRGLCQFALSGQAVEFVGDSGFVLLDTTLTDELQDEGLARDLIRVVQQARKDADFHVSDRIVLSIDGDAEVERALTAHRELIAGETLATDIQTTPLPSETHSVGEHSTVRVQVERS